MLPNLIIIGAMKSATTSLHEYLSHHPDIFMSKRKELNFFVAQQEWSKGIAWYESHFSEAAKVRGESSPNYTRYPLFDGVPERMHEILPEAKLIYCVRDPVKRFVSHYLHSYSLGKEHRSLEEVISNSDGSAYLLCSQYYLQLEQYLKVYPVSHIKVVVLEELQRNPQEVLREVFCFLEVDSSYKDPRFIVASKKMPSVARRRRSPLKSWMVRSRLRGVYWIERNLPWLFGPPMATPKLHSDHEKVLLDTLVEDTQKLQRLTGREFAMWSTARPAVK